MKTLEQLQAELEQAIKDCARYARPAHQVRNCPSDLQNEVQAWRRRRGLEYQIAELKKDVDKCLICGTQ
jgi:hypothetical protein